MFQLHGWQLLLSDETFEWSDQLKIRRRRNVRITTKDKQKSAQKMFDNKTSERLTALFKICTYLSWVYTANTVGYESLSQIYE